MNVLLCDIFSECCEMQLLKELLHIVCKNSSKRDAHTEKCLVNMNKKYYAIVIVIVIVYKNFFLLDFNEFNDKKDIQ